MMQVMKTINTILLMNIIRYSDATKYGSINLVN